MHRFVLIVAVLLFPLSAFGQDNNADVIRVGPNDWPWWRGPNRNGVADAKQSPPLKWSETENVLWKSPVPGRGHGSPIVVGDHIFVPTADHADQTQAVLCYHRVTGKKLWETVVHRGGFTKGGNAKSSLASSTCACDGQRVFVTFLNNNAIWATALDRDGTQLWQTKVTDYVLHQGFANSPTVYGPLLIVNADNKGKGVVAGLSRATGKIVWKVDRPKLPNYASPIILKVAGKEQLFLTGCKLVTSLDPLTGHKNWEFPGSTEETVTSTVSDGKCIIISGGYPKQHVAAIQADGSGKTAWEIKTQIYVPSMQFHKGHLFAVHDSGMAICFDFNTGKEVWKGRLGGSFSASPVLVGDLLYASNENGKTFIYKADPKEFELLAENQLGSEILATPTICGSRIYLRVAFRDKGARQEYLYCIGK